METSVWEILVKGAPESILAALCVYYFCDIKRPKTGEMLLLWAILMIVTFISRSVLQMTGYGMSLLITMAVLVVIFNLIAKIPLTKVINGTLMLVLFLIISEALNFLSIHLLFPEKMELILKDSNTRMVYTIPSTIILAVQVFLVYYFKFMRKRKDV